MVAFEGYCSACRLFRCRQTFGGVTRQRGCVTHPITHPCDTRIYMVPLTLGENITTVETLTWRPKDAYISFQAGIFDSATKQKY